MLELPDWDGDHPLFLLLALDEGWVAVDLDEKGWIAKLGERMREPGTWHLCRKLPDGFSILFSMAVLPGEQPYYVARHIGQVGVKDGVAQEVVCYGIGKKRVDGFVDRIWLLPNDQIVVGDNVELFARGMIPTG